MTFLQRMIGAAKLDAATYENVEADQTAMGQAMVVVGLSAIAAGIGSIEAGTMGVIAGILGALIGWFVWAFIIFLVGTKILPEPQTEADVGQLLRTLGFAASPGLLRVLGLIPGIGPLINLVIAFWMLAAMVIAVRQALDYRSTGRAVGVCLIGFLAYLAIAIGLALLLGAAGAIGGAVMG